MSHVRFILTRQILYLQIKREGGDDVDGFFSGAITPKNAAEMQEMFTPAKWIDPLVAYKTGLIAARFFIKTLTASGNSEAYFAQTARFRPPCFAAYRHSSARLSKSSTEAIPPFFCATPTLIVSLISAP